MSLPSDVRGRTGEIKTFPRETVRWKKSNNGDTTELVRIFKNLEEIREIDSANTQIEHYKEFLDVVSKETDPDSPNRKTWNELEPKVQEEIKATALVPLRDLPDAVLGWEVIFSFKKGRGYSADNYDQQTLWSSDSEDVTCETEEEALRYFETYTSVLATDRES